MRLALCLTLLLALALPSHADDLLISKGAVWKYLDDGSNQGSAWTAPTFDDSAWASGPAELGYGDGDEATVVGYGGNSSQKYATTYFRTSFNVTNPALYLALSLNLRRDDGVAVYLNGTEVARDNLATGAAYNTFADHSISGVEEDIFYSFHFDAAGLVAGNNVLAVEVHQVSPTSSDISLDLELIGRTAPFVARGPYLQMGSDTSIHVRWRSYPASDSVVLYGNAPGNLTQSASDGTVTTEHEVVLSGLAPLSTVFYAIGDQNGVLEGDDADHYFRTPAPPGTPQDLRIWVLGDSGTQDANQAAVRDAYATFSAGVDTDLILLLGDNAYGDGSDAQMQAAVFDMYHDFLLHTVVWPTRGNHEKSAATYFDAYSLPTAGELGGVPSGTEAYYSFDYADVHFICLASFEEDRSVGGAQWTWLQADLAANLQPWIIAFWHHPPYSKGSHNSDTETAMREMRENFLPLLEDYGVDVVLSGHSHSYERSYLIDGHYGLSSTFGPANQVDGGDGNPTGDGAYAKAAGPHAGAVYTVTGSAGKTGGGSLDHPAMATSKALLGSVVLDIDGGRLRQRFLRNTAAVGDRYTLLIDTFEGSYCTALPHSGGCAGTLSASGTPSATSAAPFWITADQLVPGQFGLLFYGYAPAATPFVAGGKLCVGAPLVRLPALPTGGSGACGGSFAVDFNQRIQSGADAGLVPGAVVYCQGWYRDPMGGSGSVLTDARQFTIRP